MVKAMEDSKLDRQVAVKSFKSMSEDENICQDAVREIVVAANLCNCDSLVDILDVHFRHDGIYTEPMLVMKHMHGYLKVNPKTPHPNVDHIIMQIASGVEHMHARGYMHRDLKPQNLLVSRDGR